MCLTSVQVYTYLVTNFGNPVELGNLVWSVRPDLTTYSRLHVKLPIDFRENLFAHICL
jgi:hypothetical protein